MLAQDGLWMKLNPLNRKCFMLYTHNFFNRAIWLIGPAGHFKTIWQCFLFNH